jgi:TatD DNase family protein
MPVLSGAEGLTDSHCHLQDPKFGRDMPQVIERARAAGVSTMVVIGYDMDSSHRAVEIAESNEGVFATIGVHPHDAKTLTPGDISTPTTLAESPMVVAIGEIGLDFYRNLSPPDVQHRAFREQLALARELDLPVVIHSRDADEEVFEELAEHAEATSVDWPAERPLGVMHCYAGDIMLADRYIALGFLLSIAGTATYPNAEKTREVARAIPLGSLLIETDAPYLTPQSRRGQRNEPAYLVETVRFIAELRGEPPELIAKETASNAKRLFALDRVAQPTGDRA